MMQIHGVALFLLLLNPESASQSPGTEPVPYVKSVFPHMPWHELDAKDAPKGVAFVQIVVAADGRVGNVWLLEGRPAHEKHIATQLVGRMMPPPPIAGRAPCVVVPLAFLFGKQRDTEPELVAGLASQDSLVRELAASSIRGMKFHSPATVDALTAALGDSSPGVREAAASGIRRLGRHARRSTTAVCPLLVDADADVRAAAAWAADRCAAREP
jgi:hypothetical protein